MNNARILKTSKGEFYLLGPGHLKMKIDGTLDDAWSSLQREIDSHYALLAQNGIADESNSFDLKKVFAKSFWLENLLRGIILAVPLFLILFLFSLTFVRQVTKLGDKFAIALDPVKLESVHSSSGFQGVLLRYRPYLFEILKAFEEEKEKLKKVNNGRN